MSFSAYVLEPAWRDVATFFGFAAGCTLFITPSEIRLNLVDPQAQRHELRLRAQRNGSMPVIAVTVNRRQK
jgi:hypothetical protein